jgi:hypothetical protein
MTVQSVRKVSDTKTTSTGSPLMGRIIAPDAGKTPKMVLGRLIPDNGGAEHHVLGRITMGGKPAPAGTKFLGRIIPESDAPPGGKFLGRIIDPDGKVPPHVVMGRLVTPNGKSGAEGHGLVLGRIIAPSSNGKPVMGRIIPPGD